MAEIVDRLEVLEALLRAPLRISKASRQAFPARWRVKDAVIVTHRFILLEEGELDYTVEGRPLRVRAGEQFFIPAWCRREWRATAKGCRLLWCEFSSGAVTVPPVLCRREAGAGREERRSLERVLKLFGEGETRERMLEGEGELKAALARFWIAALAEGRGSGDARARHPEVARAVAWLERHYAEPDALEAFYRTVELSPNHFRLLFRREQGETVQAVLARLRLRRARYLVQETVLPMKRIAAETGFADPLYFSGQYRKFWGRAATEDRAGGGVA
jgi:AraC-like DNA-binding protein